MDAQNSSDPEGLSSSIWASLLQSALPTSNEPYYVIGLDFGTSNSCISVWRRDKNRVKIVKNTKGEKVTPSILHFRNNFQEYFVGNLENYTPELTEEERTEQFCSVQGIKSLLGLTKLEDVPEYFSHECVVEEDELVVRLVDRVTGKLQQFSAEDLVSLVLSYLRASMLSYLRKKPLPGALAELSVQHAVLGVPAHFPERKREALRRAAQSSGFETVHFLVESTAAALGYGLLVAGEKRALVVDVGGGTTDVTLLHLRDGRHRVLYTFGQPRLGGHDFDGLVAAHLHQNILRELEQRDISLPPAPLSADPALHQLLHREGRRLKESLSTEEEVRWDYAAVLRLLAARHPAVRPLLDQAEGSRKRPRRWELVLGRETFERWTAPLLGLAEETLRHSLRQHLAVADASALRVDEVVLVGGSTRIPALRRAVRRVLGEFGLTAFAPSDPTARPKEFCQSIDADCAVAEGLAVRAAILSGEDSAGLRDVLMLDCLPATIGLLLWDPALGRKFFEPLLPQGTALPVRAHRHRLPLAASAGRVVTLELFEELEEIGPGCEGPRLSYSLLASCDVPVEAAPRPRKSSGPAEAEVVLSVDEEAVLSFRVEEAGAQADEEVAEEAGAESLWGGQSGLLLLYAAFLLAAYVAVKILFPSLPAPPAPSPLDEP